MLWAAARDARHRPQSEPLIATESLQKILFNDLRRRNRCTHALTGKGCSGKRFSG